MGRYWAMGCSASNAASDLAERARAQAFTRDELIRQIMGQDGVDYDTAAAAAQLDYARRVLQIKGQDNSPDAERYGAPAPMFVNGEVYQTVQVHREADGRIYREGVRFNGPLMSTVRVREERDGGDFTRVVAEAR